MGQEHNGQKTISTSPAARGTGQATTVTSDRSASVQRILPRSPMIGIRWRRRTW
jgi:hypothetical protein